MNPMDAFKRALFYVSGLCSQRMLNKPGAVVVRLSPETRKSLQELKSSDISSVRDDEIKYFVSSEDYNRNKEFQKEMFDFDKKILK